MEFDEALARLDALINYEVIPRAGKIEGLTLEPMQQLMALLGDPQQAFPVIHITGTNGKGSTTRLMESLLQTMGLRVGTYTSPHLDSVTERIRLGGEPIDEAAFGAAVGTVLTAIEASGQEAMTWFETVTAAALLEFANEAVDVAIVEVGMLGRYDATNVVTAQVAVVTNIGLDHSSGEGEWRQAIASEKAGIIEPTSTLVLGETDTALHAIFLDEGPARSVIRGETFELTDDRLAVGGRLVGVRTPRGLYDEVFVSLHGSYQAENASLALTAVEEFFDAPLPDDVVEEAFGTVVVPGRLEVVHRGPTIVVDTAHNVPGAEALAESIADDFGQGGRRYLVLGMQDGRVPVDVARALQVANYQLVATCTAPTARGVDAEVLADAVRTAGGNADAVFDVESAFDHVYNQAEDDDLIVVAGSNPVVGVVRSLAEDL
ncbi:MAG: Mur ligase family protein [Actinomycetota bacterium]